MATPAEMQEIAKRKYSEKATDEAWKAGLPGADEEYCKGLVRFTGGTCPALRQENYRKGIARAVATNAYAAGVSGKADRWLERYLKKMKPM